MNWKMFVARHWKAISIVALVGVAVLSMTIAKSHAEPIDTPCGP